MPSATRPTSSASISGASTRGESPFSLTYASTSWRTQLATSFGGARLQRGDRALGVVGEAGHVDEHARVLVLDAPRLDEPGAPGGRELGHRRAHLGAHLVGRRDRHEIGLGEVAVVVRLFLRAARDRAAAVFVPVPRLLHDPLAGLDQRRLPFGLVLDRRAAASAAS